ncbi:MAG: MFS transporter, partial [Aggregatilineales bacterium]
MRDYFQLLRENPGLTKLWLAQVISLTGDWFTAVVLAALVSDYSDGSGRAISLYLLLRFIPPMLISPYSGVLVDRFNRKQIMFLSNLLRFFTVPFFLLATTPDRLWIIYVVTFIQFTLSAFFEPAQSAIIPALVKPGKLVEANTLATVTWSVMLAGGAIIGGVFASVFGSVAALTLDAFTFLIAAGFIMWIDYDPAAGLKHRKAQETEAEKAKNDEEEDTSFMEGIRYILRTPEMAAALFIKFGQSVGNIDTLVIVFATQLFVLGDGKISLALTYSAFGIGAVIGPMLTNRANDGSVWQLRRLVIVGFIGTFICWFALGAAASLWMVCLALLLRGMGGSINWTYSTILIQKTAPDRKLGRMFSMDWTGYYVASMLSTLLHGAIIDAVGTEFINEVAFATGFVAFIPLVIW